MKEIIDILHRENCSCVILSEGSVTICRERGVKDLYRLLADSPQTLHGAYIADKVIGKGAAALMVLGGVSRVYADVVSEAAIGLFASSDIEISYAEKVPAIINRAGTGICPVEQLCAQCASAEECLPLIENFLNTIDKKH